LSFLLLVSFTRCTQETPFDEYFIGKHQFRVQLIWNVCVRAKITKDKQGVLFIKGAQYSY